MPGKREGTGAGRGAEIVCKLADLDLSRLRDAGNERSADLRTRDAMATLKVATFDNRSFGFSRLLLR